MSYLSSTKQSGYSHNNFSPLLALNFFTTFNLSLMRCTFICITVILTGTTCLSQCPTLGQNATFTSADCQPGSNPCALCPGDAYTLTPTGNDLHPGDCINWYINDVPNFNPYNGQGTLLGCSELSSPPPDPCNPNPILLGLFVNACGTEENNEFLGLWSGGGFNVSDLMVSYDDPNNNGCGWQTPSPALQAGVSDDCPGAIFVGAGETVPGNVPVIVFTSSDADFNYNLSGLCSTSGTVYVLQSDCSHATEVFPNTGSGSATTGVSIGCWSETITYNLAQVTNVNGAFVADIPILGTIYGQAGCAWPSFPGLPGTDPVVNIAPLNVVVDQDQCNNGPYYIVGIYEPLPAGCPQTFTNYLSYDVPCPTPVLGTASICSSVSNYNLVQLQDPEVPDGAWSGDGVTGNIFNATGLDGPVELTFTPTSPCGTPATTVINVSGSPEATFDPVQPVCAGGTTILTINLTGTPSWTFNVFANGSLLNAYTVTESPLEIPVNPLSNTNYSIQNLVTEAGCTGPNTSIIAMVSNTSPSAELSLAGNDTICAGSSTLISVNFSGGTPPFDFVYDINGTPQTPQINISQDPFLFPITIFNNSNITLVSVTDDNGCTGTVSGSAFVRILPAPKAILTSDTTTICAGESDTLSVSLTGTAPFSFVYRINGVNQTPITTNISPYKIVVSPTSGSTVYTLSSVTDSICVGAVSGIYRIEVTPTPTAFLIGMDTICAGQSANLTIDFNGSGPFTVFYTANNMAESPIQTTDDPYTFQVFPTTSTTYTLTSMVGGSCTGTVSGNASIAVPPAPTGLISGGGQICQGGSGTTVSINFTGIAPFTFVYSTNNIPQAPITTSLNTYTFSVNPGVGTGYRLVSLHDAVCDGTVSGIAQVFVFVPASANLSGSATFCDSAVTNIMVDFNGSGPFTIEYTINDVVQPLVYTPEDPYFIPVSVNSTTVFKLTNVESPGCIGTPSGVATITVNHPPTYANLDLNCNLGLSNYTVSFAVLNATLPLTLVSGSGSFTGNQFNSTAIPLSSGYDFQFHDANNCGNITVAGASTCNCTTASGSVLLDPIQVCQSQTATATFTGGFVDDGDDVLQYILHSSPGLPLGTIYAWSSTPSFGFQGAMTPEVTYYISAIAGNQDGAGQVDLNDPCLSVSQGVPVIFHALPNGDIGLSSPSVCLGDSLEINVAFSGTPPFSFTPMLNGVVQNTVSGILGSSAPWVIFPTNDVDVTLSNISDKYCPSGITSGTVNVSVFSPPVVGSPFVTCDYLSNTYSIEFAVSGTPPFNINGLLGSFSGSIFTSLPIPFGTAYQAFIGDADQCGQDTLVGMGICSCTSDAGEMDLTPVKACKNTTITVSDALFPVTDLGDILLYILHTSSGNTPGTILAWSSTPSFAFGGSMVSNTTYYISAIVGNPDGAGQINLNDPCLSTANGTPVLWYPSPTASLSSGTFNICPGQSQALLVTLTGTPGYTLTYTSNGNPFTVFPSQNLFSVNAQLQQSATLVLTSITDANGCVGTVSGQAQVNVHTKPMVVNLTPNCQINDQTYTLEFDVTNADLSTVSIANITGNFNPVTGHFISDPIALGQPYSFIVTDAWGCGNFSASSTVECSCVTDAGSMVGGGITLCPTQNAVVAPATGVVLEPEDALLYLLVTSQSPTSWTIIGSNTTPSFSFNPTTMSYETTYFIVAAAGNSSAGVINYNDPCLSVVTGPSVLWRTPITATISGMDTICIGNTASLQVNFSGNGPYFFTYSTGGVNQVLSNIVQNPYSIAVTPQATSVYTLVGVSGAGTCLGTVAGSAVIQVNNPPQPVHLLESCDLVTETYVLSFDISNGAATNASYSISGLAGNLVDTTFTSLSFPGTQPYTVTISDDAGCSTTINGQPSCICTSSAGTLTNVQDACLPGGQVTAQSSGNSNLDADDIIHYFLCSNPNQLPAGLFSEQNSPQFGFQPGMTAETTYYIVIGVGNALPNGTLDFSDPCLSLSTGSPVVFHNAPTATIGGSLLVCPGGSTSFTVQFSGKAPFTFSYALNGTPQPSQVAVGNSMSILTSDVLQSQIFTLTSVQDANCTGTVSGQVTVDITPQPTASLVGDATICVGDTTSLTLILTGATVYDVIITGGTTPILLSAVQNGFMVPVSPSSTTTYSISNLLASGNGCIPIIGNSAVVKTDQINATTTLSNYNGYSVSCPNDTDGSITVTPISGNMPITALWTDGATGLIRSGLGAGTYQVILTNQIGCTLAQTVILQAPTALDIVLDAIGPVCYGKETGSITIQNITGGTGPFSLLLNDIVQGSVDLLPITLDRLGSGTYTIGVENANGCISYQATTVPTPVEFTVDLGSDTTVNFGDSLLISAIHNAVQLDTFVWSTTNYLSTPERLETWCRPSSSQLYKIYLRDVLGCEASDDLLVRVEKGKRVYIPNIIYPQSTEFNNVITVWGGGEVSNIRYMRIFDRWGDLVFENDNFLPGDIDSGWNGTVGGKFVDPAVFVYVVEVEYINGEVEVFKGDVTVIR